MTIDDIITAFRTADVPPRAALSEARRHADALAAPVMELIGKLVDGVYLLPAQNSTLAYGLPVLAAERRADLYPQLVQLLRLPESDLDNIYPDAADIMLTRLLLSVWDGDADILFRMIEHADICDSARWALFDLLARLTFDGRIDRSRTEAFLERFERDAIAGDDDLAWLAWEDAVTLLGITALEPALRRVWTKGINTDKPQADSDEALARLARAASNPGDPTDFRKAQLQPIDDPVEAMEWVEVRNQMVADLADKERDEQDQPAGRRSNGRAADQASDPTEAELDWLEGFLASRQAPASSMTLEMLDGFLTALAIGPAAVPSSQYLATVWGTEDGRGPGWDSPEQMAFVLDLLERLSSEIAARAAADEPIEPLLMPLADDERGMDWATGFEEAVLLCPRDWEPMGRNKRGSELVSAVLALTGEHDDEFEEPVTPQMRASTLHDLPVILQLIAAYWRSGPGALRREPLRSAKVGRNDLCPCGSGKKFKKCCGGTTPATIH